jgi:hypothetical protein
VPRLKNRTWVLVVKTITENTVNNKSYLAIIALSVTTVFGAHSVSDNEYYVNIDQFEGETPGINELVEIENDGCLVIQGSFQPLVAPEHLGVIGVQYKDKKWRVFHNNKEHVLQNCDVDPLLRTIDNEKLAAFYGSGCYVLVGQYTDGGFNLKAKVRGLGGGIWGAMGGAYFGKFAVHFVCHGAILIAGACTGPAAPATIAALEATFLPTIEAASTIVALSGGIAGAVITGPV